MRYPHLYTRLYGTPLLIHPDKAAVIEAVFRAQDAGQITQLSAESIHIPAPEAAAYRAQRFADKPFILTDAGVAVIPVVGSLVQRGSGIDALSGMTSYASLERTFDRTLADSDVRGILLEFDTHGGEAAGVFDLAARIAGARGQKPIWASSNEAAFSAGYAIAAAADRIVLPRTGRVGSIGVIAMHVDQSVKDKKAGVTYTPIFAGARKADGNPHAPLTSDARGRIQGMVDALYAHFVGHVAQMRGLAEDQVRATEAGVFLAADAVIAGLADSIQSFNDTLAEFESFVAGRGAFTTGGFAARQSQGDISMSDPKAPAGDDPKPAANPAAPDLAAVKAEAATAERARVQAILTCSNADGREKMAQHLAFNTAMGAEEAKGLLAVSPIAPLAAAQPNNPLAAAMAGIANPTVGADAHKSVPDDEASLAARVVSFAPKRATR